jgi:predicted ArsR family transcriptional regulator
MTPTADRTERLQQQARALGDPTRHGIFRHVAAADAPVGVAELTEHFGFNHNAIRQHLAKLVAAGLVADTKSPGPGRGRPRLVYTLTPDAEGQWGTEGAYERLSRMLIEIIRTGATPEEVGRRHSSLVAGAGDALETLHDEMARQGFQPERRDRPRSTELVLRTCPFETAAIADRDTVCAIHLGIAQGITEGTDLTVDELIANDPRTASCRLRVHYDDVSPDAPSPVLTIRTTRR